MTQPMAGGELSPAAAWSQRVRKVGGKPVTLPGSTAKLRSATASVSS